MTADIVKLAKKLGLRGLYIAVLLLALTVPARHFVTPFNSHKPARPTAPAQSKPVVTGNKPVGGTELTKTGQTSVSSLAILFNSTKPSTSSNVAIVARPQGIVKPTVSKSPKIVRNLANKTVIVGDITYPLRTYTTLMTPNDPLASQPWIASTNMSQAWDIPTGNHDTLLAVIDTGFALKHEEFNNRWYVNPGESGAATTENPSQLNCTDRGLPVSASCNLIDDDANGTVDDESGPATYQNPSRLNCTAQHKPLTKDCNRIDDDGNGYIDDVSGWDFANNDNSPQAGELNPNGSGTTHGTETAGTAAATGNNGKGIAGADWHTKILPIQALDDDSYGDTLSVGRAIQYAASQHANVISISLGSVSSDDYVRYSIAMAIAEGSTVVAAAGNTSCDCMLYPANYPEVVSVGALDTSNNPASFTSYGTNLDIMAPGTQVTAPTFTAGNGVSAYASNLAGTSFSTPMVSGLLTRLLSRQPNESSLQLIAALTESTNRTALSANTSRTAQLGYGRVDALKATNRVVNPLTSSLLYTFSPVSKGEQLYPGSPTEVTPVVNYSVQRCQDGQLGTTPLYELSEPGSSSNLWSVSQSEVWQAQQYSGYTAKLFAEVCLQQPQDTATATRGINLFKEFRNIYETPQMSHL